MELRTERSCSLIRKPEVSPFLGPQQVNRHREEVKQAKHTVLPRSSLGPGKTKPRVDDGDLTRVVLIAVAPCKLLFGIIFAFYFYRPPPLSFLSLNLFSVPFPYIHFCFLWWVSGTSLPWKLLAFKFPFFWKSLSFCVKKRHFISDNNYVARSEEIHRVF